ncbi:MAG: hypothetical protein WCQ50_16090, partial [Spirochaetota bacterium]
MDITLILTALSQNGYGKRPIQIITKRMAESIGNVIDEEGKHPQSAAKGWESVRKLEQLYFGLW